VIPDPGARRELTTERLEAAVAVLVAISVQLLMPEKLVLGPVLLLPVAEAVLLVVMLVGRIAIPDPRHPGLRAVSLVLVALMILATVASTARLVESVITGDAVSAQDLIRAGLGIWLTNVIAFALLYWEMDLGGPGVRAQEPAPADLPVTAGTGGLADFLFPQYDSSRVPHDWRPAFADYLYTSFTNATAFSPTDTMPLRHRSKALMALQSSVAMITMAFLLARAVNVLQ